MDNLSKSVLEVVTSVWDAYISRFGPTQVDLTRQVEFDNQLHEITFTMRRLLPGSARKQQPALDGSCNGHATELAKLNCRVCTPGMRAVGLSDLYPDAIVRPLRDSSKYLCNLFVVMDTITGTEAMAVNYHGERLKISAADTVVLMPNVLGQKITTAVCLDKDDHFLTSCMQTGNELKACCCGGRSESGRAIALFVGCLGGIVEAELPGDTVVRVGRVV